MILPQNEGGPAVVANFPVAMICIVRVSNLWPLASSFCLVWSIQIIFALKVKFYVKKKKCAYKLAQY